jgi:hypothetical protein
MLSGWLVILRAVSLSERQWSRLFNSRERNSYISHDIKREIFIPAGSIVVMHAFFLIPLPSL